MPSALLRCDAVSVEQEDKIITIIASAVKDDHSKNVKYQRAKYGWRRVCSQSTLLKHSIAYLLSVLHTMDYE